MCGGCQNSTSFRKSSGSVLLMANSDFPVCWSIAMAASSSSDTPNCLGVKLPKGPLPAASLELSKYFVVGLVVHGRAAFLPAVTWHCHYGSLGKYVKQAVERLFVSRHGRFRE